MVKHPKPLVEIAGTGRYLPERVLTNADLERMVETSDEWIQERTGIRERRIAAEGEGAADMAAHASLFRTESRWGLYHLRSDYPEKDNENWFCHALLGKENGKMVSEKHAVADYVVPIAEDEKDLYDKQRVVASAS